MSQLLNLRAFPNTSKTLVFILSHLSAEQLRQQITPGTDHHPFANMEKWQQPAEWWWCCWSDLLAQSIIAGLWCPPRWWNLWFVRALVNTQWRKEQEPCCVPAWDTVFNICRVSIGCFVYWLPLNDALVFMGCSCACHCKVLGRSRQHVSVKMEQKWA